MTKKRAPQLSKGQKRLSKSDIDEARDIGQGRWSYDLAPAIWAFLVGSGICFVMVAIGIKIYQADLSADHIEKVLHEVGIIVGNANPFKK